MEATQDTKTLKDVFTTLKEIIVHANLVFDHDGLRISQVDTERASLVEVQLLNFDAYEFSFNSPVTICINVPYVQKILKSAEPGSIASLRIREDDIGTLQVAITKEGQSGGVLLSLPSMLLPLKKVVMSTDQYEIECEIPLKIFHVAIKEAAHTSRYITIQILPVNGVICIKAESSVGTFMRNIEPTVWNRRSSDVFQQQFYSRYIERFLKFETADTLTLKFQDDRPFILELPVRSVGIIRYAIASMV